MSLACQGRCGQRKASKIEGFRGIVLLSELIDINNTLIYYKYSYNSIHNLTQWDRKDKGTKTSEALILLVGTRN